MFGNCRVDPRIHGEITLRRHPEHLNRDAETLGPQLVLNGSSAYIEVHLYFKMSVYKHDISLEFFIFI